MMTIEKLLTSGAPRQYGAQLEMDPLTEEDALLEAQLLDVRFDALRCTLALLFELRLALQLREGNTGVLVAHGVRRCSWVADSRPTALTAWNVAGSTPRVANQLLTLTLAMSPHSELELVAESAAFYVGDVPGLAEMPDYSSSDEDALNAGLATFSSLFRPIHAVFLERAPEVEA